MDTNYLNFRILLLKIIGSISWNQKNYFAEIMVKTSSLDDYAKKNNIDRIDFLKVDVEGSEIDCLIGAKNLKPHHTKIFP